MNRMIATFVVDIAPDSGTVTAMSATSSWTPYTQSPSVAVPSNADRVARVDTSITMPDRDARPTHPAVAATILMVAVAVFLVLIAAAGL